VCTRRGIVAVVVILGGDSTCSQWTCGCRSSGANTSLAATTTAAATTTTTTTTTTIA
jgi:hypothetical protein